MITTKQQATAYLDKYIPKDRDFKFPGELGMQRTAYLLKLLGDPQNKLKVIHIAGTSGKGSTSYLISIILRSLGFKVGLCVSPILVDTRERFQINNQLIAEQEYFACLDKIIFAVTTLSQTKFGPPTYYEILVALTYYIFQKEQVDYAVIETGLGGLLDGTNVATRQDKLAVITQIGLDHTAILGKTLEKIAFQKAGIIYRGNTVLTIKQNPKVLRVIEKQAQAMQSKYYVIGPKNIRRSSLLPAPKFDFSFMDRLLKSISLRMKGSFQIQNCSLALATAIILSHRDGFDLDNKRIQAALAVAEFPGRMQEIKINGQTIVVDGAHNPQKMRMLAKNLKNYFPEQKFSFMIALKRGKDYKEILRLVIPIASRIIVTSFKDQTQKQGSNATAEDAKAISQLFHTLCFKKYVLYRDSHVALKELLKEKGSIKVITGSLYLISEIYSHIKNM